MTTAPGSRQAGRTGRWVRRLERAGLAVAGTCVAAIMFIVVVDAGGRYLLGQPLRWAFDLIANYLLVVAAWLAVSATFTSGDHIAIHLLHARLQPRARAAAGIVWGVAAIALFGAIGVAGASHAIDAWRDREFYPGAVMWPVWASYAPIPVGAALLVLRLVHHVATLAAHGADPEVVTGETEPAE